MLDFSSSNIFPTMSSNGWFFEKPLSYDDHRNNTTMSITMPQFQTDQTTNELMFEGLPIDNIIDFPSSCLKESEFDVESGLERSLMAKKLNHNASERNRRKKMNFLYSTLRSLLPPPNCHQKVLS